MMTADVRELPWSMLQPCATQPPAVLASVTPDDLSSFLRTLAINPLVETEDASVLKFVLAEFRAKHAELVLSAHITVRPKRKRPDSLDEGDTGSSEGERRARRSTRPKTRQGMSNVDDFIASGKSRGTEPKVGPEHQADVPPVVVPVPRRTESMTEVRSTLVYSPELCQGKERVSGFLENLRTTLERRDGFGYSPNGEEKGLQLLTSHKGDVEAALDDTCKVVQVGREFDGVGKPWTYDEKCMFVRAIAEREQDFSYISRNCLNRPTSELVNMFYTYQQQQQFMHGSSAAGHIFDTGEELAQFLPRLGPERVNTAFRCLGKTAGDGFPADRRVAKAIKAVRTNSIYDQRTKRARSTRSGKPFAARPS